MPSTPSAISSSAASAKCWNRSRLFSVSTTLFGTAPRTTLYCTGNGQVCALPMSPLKR
jgi:hypothetical protein